MCTPYTIQHYVTKFERYTLFLQLMKRMKILFTIKRQTPLSTTVITSYMDLKLLSWFVKPVPSTACMLHYLLYESKIQITIRAGHKRVSGIWRISRFLHVQCNLYQLLISNILFELSSRAHSKGENSAISTLSRVNLKLMSIWPSHSWQVRNISWRQMPFIRPKKYVNEKSPNALKNHEPIILIDHKLMVYVYRCLMSLPTRRKHLHVQSNCQIL
jgi:hypothetical protein